ncbi:hypothetical protein [Mesorhizobium sp. M1365]|uniref:hypothetical protein n=1 Tax=Mesorhizobium sp. M1365 TaxID=2957090 RepID=UPI00333B6719
MKLAEDLLSDTIWQVGGWLMNIKRGLVRVWIVLSAAYVVGVCYVYGPAVKEGFDRENQFETFDVSRYTVPVLCSGARGQEGPDFEREHVITPDVGYLCGLSQKLPRIQ